MSTVGICDPTLCSLLGSGSQYCVYYRDLGVGTCHYWDLGCWDLGIIILFTVEIWKSIICPLWESGRQCVSIAGISELILCPLLDAGSQYFAHCLDLGVNTVFIQ